MADTGFASHVPDEALAFSTAAGSPSLATSNSEPSKRKRYKPALEGEVLPIGRLHHSMASRIKDNTLRFPGLDFPTTDPAQIEAEKAEKGKAERLQGNVSLPAIVSLAEKIRTGTREPAIRTIGEVHVTKVSSEVKVEAAKAQLDNRESILGAVDFLRAQEKQWKIEVAAEREKILQRTKMVEKMQQKHTLGGRERRGSRIDLSKSANKTLNVEIQNKKAYKQLGMYTQVNENDGDPNGGKNFLAHNWANVGRAAVLAEHHATWSKREQMHRQTQPERHLAVAAKRYENRCEKTSANRKTDREENRRVKKMHRHWLRAVYFAACTVAFKRRRNEALVDARMTETTTTSFRLALAVSRGIHRFQELVRTKAERNRVKHQVGILEYFLRLMVACNLKKEQFKYEMRRLRTRVIMVQRHWRALKRIREAQIGMLELRFIQLEKQINRDDLAHEGSFVVPTSIRRSCCKESLAIAVAKHVVLDRAWMDDIWPFFYQSYCEEQLELNPQESRANTRKRAERMKAHGLMLPWLAKKFGPKLVSDYPTTFSILITTDIYKLVMDSRHGFSPSKATSRAISPEGKQRDLGKLLTQH
jgi:hypothetical protein